MNIIEFEPKFIDSVLLVVDSIKKYRTDDPVVKKLINYIVYATDTLIKPIKDSKYSLKVKNPCGMIVPFSMYIAVMSLFHDILVDNNEEIDIVKKIENAVDGLTYAVDKVCGFIGGIIREMKMLIINLIASSEAEEETQTMIT